LFSIFWLLPHPSPPPTRTHSVFFFGGGDFSLSPLWLFVVVVVVVFVFDSVNPTQWGMHNLSPFYSLSLSLSRVFPFISLLFSTRTRLFHCKFMRRLRPCAPACLRWAFCLAHAHVFVTCPVLMVPFLFYFSVWQNSEGKGGKRKIKGAFW
jgi:hypothetical protein